jgi:hypothetical protein
MSLSALGSNLPVPPKKEKSSYWHWNKMLLCGPSVYLSHFFLTHPFIECSFLGPCCHLVKWVKEVPFSPLTCVVSWLLTQVSMKAFTTLKLLVLWLTEITLQPDFLNINLYWLAHEFHFYFASSLVCLKGSLLSILPFNFWVVCDGTVSRLSCQPLCWKWHSLRFPAKPMLSGKEKENIFVFFLSFWHFSF